MASATRCAASTGTCAGLCWELLHPASCPLPCPLPMLAVTPLADVECRVLTRILCQNYQQGVVIPDAYPRLILDAIRGDQQHFVRRWAAGPPAVERRCWWPCTDCATPRANKASSAAAAAAAAADTTLRACHCSGTSRLPAFHANTRAVLMSHHPPAGTSCALHGQFSRRCCTRLMRGACLCTPTPTAAGAGQV